MYDRYLKLVLAGHFMLTATIGPYGETANATEVQESHSAQSFYEVEVYDIELNENSEENVNSILHLETDSLDFNGVVLKRVDENLYLVYSQEESLRSSECGLSQISMVRLEKDSSFSVTEPFSSMENDDLYEQQMLEEQGAQTIFSWPVFRDCAVNDLGMSWAVLGTLSMFCGAACASSGGLLCAPCIYATAAITGANWGWCIGKAANF
ncbi:hypothetical protein [Evansella halocellulosilytica]|uniref:hypothetical protein n=1 Tax=Evansella halocellulosilytica TaxID=2011013 RepID=UPI000BB85726|nr:hypothetical protein [Evansella halocellulosilytica]